VTLFSKITPIPRGNKRNTNHLRFEELKAKDHQGYLAEKKVEKVTGLEKIS